VTISRRTARRAAAGAGLLLGAWLVAGAGTDPGPSWEVARPGFAWSFPRDHWAHPAYKTEWWYFTGHLTVQGESTPRFGYQFTLFRIGLAPGASPLDSRWATRELIMGHASLSDLREKRHVFSDVLYREIPLLGGFGTFPDSLIAWCRGPAGTAARWTLRWNGTAFDLAMEDSARGIAFALSTTPVKPRVFQGPGGYSRKGETASEASLYYSFTRLRTEGTVRENGTSFPVTGQSWMDKEFGSNQLGRDQVGWDWFSLQLEDGRDIMLYELRDENGDVDFARATVVSAEGRAHYLEEGAWTVRATGHWTSPESGIRYPSGWAVELPTEDLRLTVRPLLPDQENRSQRSSGLTYWEGAVEILEDGRSAGQGYVELTGYGERNRPAL